MANTLASTEYSIEVDDVSMIFNMASQQLNNLKEYFIAAARHELYFKEFRALDHVSFKVRRGEVVGLVGTNGSGKSTMLKCIAGVLEPSEGSITVRGNIAPLIELGAGFDPELTARENIYLNGALLGYSKAFIDEHLESIIDFAELADFMDMPLKNYSSGMVARIAFAIATVTEPDVLIVDETLSVGDMFFQKKCEDRIGSFIESGNVTVLFVSHSIEQVERICQRAVWIEKGHLLMDGPVSEVCDAYRLGFAGVKAGAKVKDDWLEQAKAWSRGEEVVTASGKGPFGSENVTREQFATMLWRYAECPESDFSLEVFHDYDKISEWALKGLRWIVETGIMHGRGDTGILDPAASVTREQVGFMIERFEKLGDRADEGGADDGAGRVKENL